MSGKSTPRASQVRLRHSSQPNEESCNRDHGTDADRNAEDEQRLAAMLRADNELAPLFRFNWLVDTVRGSRPRVDLVWVDGRLVVELDGYPDHSTRRALIGDRHRDYELMLSGYTVLRLANDEVEQDYGRAIEKIRDLVRLRRMQMNQEG